MLLQIPAFTIYKFFLPNSGRSRELTAPAGIAPAGKMEVASAGTHWIPFTMPWAVW